MTSVVTLILGDDPHILADLQHLRVAAWEPIVGRAEAVERFGLDGHDRRSHHLVILANGEGPPVAAGRLTPCEELADLPEATSFAPFADQMTLPLAIAGRLVVHPDHRGEGLAEQIVVARLKAARDLGLREVWSETRTSQVHGFLRHGYESMGPSADRSVIGEWTILRAVL